MTYRERLTVEVQKNLWRHGLSEAQIKDVYVTGVDVSPQTPETYLAVDCSVPLPPATGKMSTIESPAQSGDAVLHVRVILDERTALRVLFNGLLDVTNVARPRRRTRHEITEEFNQAVYAKLGKMSASRAGSTYDEHHEDDKS